MSSIWRVELFGGLRAVCGDRAVTHFRSQKTAALFAYLAYFREQSQPRERLIEQFWPDADLGSGRNSLSTALSSLRRQFDDCTHTGDELLEADRNIVRLNPSRVETDVGVFENMLDAASAHPRSLERASTLAGALDLYRGELLPGLYEPWIYPEQQRLSERAFHTYREVVAAYAQAGRMAEALEFAHRSVSLDPLREEAHLEVIRLHLRFNSATQAVRQYRELERVLHQELGVSPANATRALVAHLLTPDSHRERASETGNDPLDGPAPAETAWQVTGGALPLGSPYYVERAVDGEFHRALAQRESIVLVKGARQTGKSSMLARGLERARAAACIVLTDLEALSSSEFETLERLLLVLAQSFTDQLGLELNPEQDWNPNRGPTLNFARFLRTVIRGCDRPVVWAMDEVDRLFHCSFGDDLFALFRSWHNERALLPETPWSRLTLAISYATEARLFIRDVNLSPFNVGTRLEMGDFTLDEVAELNRRYGSPIAGMTDLQEFFAWLGGHPYLSHRALASWRHGSNVAQHATEWRRVDGVFGDHLRRLHASLTRSPELAEATARVLNGGQRLPEQVFYRLKSGGVLTGPSPDEVTVRCRLYREFLQRQNER